MHVALDPALFFSLELEESDELLEGDVWGEIRKTLKEFVRLGLLHSRPQELNARIYDIATKVSIQAAKLGAALLSQPNETLQSMKKDARLRVDSLIPNYMV